MNNSENKPTNAAEYIIYHRGIKERLKRLYERLAGIRSAAEYGSNALSLTGDRRPDNKYNDKFGNYAEIAEQTITEINDLQTIHATMIGYISTIADPQMQNILEQYYIEGISNNKIARFHNCDTRTITRKKQIAMEELKTIPVKQYMIHF